MELLFKHRTIHQRKRLSQHVIGFKKSDASSDTFEGLATSSKVPVRRAS